MSTMKLGINSKLYIRIPARTEDGHDEEQVLCLKVK